MESLDLRGYDIVLSLTSAFAHGIITSERTQHVCYCLTPARFLWNYAGYAEREGLGTVTRLALQPFLKSLRQWDRLAADRVDRFVAISRTVQARIAKYYRRDSVVLWPPVQTDSTLACSGLPKEQGAQRAYLIVSRLVPYKRIDLAVRAFSALGLPLRIIGDGRDRAALERLAGPNVSFLGYVADDRLVRREMANARALIFPGEEDFGLTPVEAMSVGTPVIAYAGGGALETIEEGVTGVFFREQTAQALVDAVRQREDTRFDPDRIKDHTQQFGVVRFRQGLARILDKAASEAGVA
jgi:glycosyltransferase involved in cell wall biosynthesis